ncbi:MAG: cupin domain-containing protein [Chloroflexi bacterium]|nr:cupin domain-containing protein [Chloroflexota bacterium]
MANEQADRASVSAVRFFDVADALRERESYGQADIPGRVDMATSDKCYVAFFQTKPRGGETHVHSHPDSDQILFVLKGECTVEGLSARYVLAEQQGVLIPAGVNYGFTNMTNEDLMFLSIRTESTGGRRVAYVPNVPSDVQFKIPEMEIGARGIGRELYVYALDRRTIGVSPLLLEEWNRAAILRMNCEYERRDAYTLANLPERMAQWYQVDDVTDTDYRIITDPERTRVRIDLSPIIDRRSKNS